MKKEVVVMGLGYVGLPSVVTHMKNGYQVIGFDIDTQKINWLEQGISCIDTITDESIQTLLMDGVLFTSDKHMIQKKDVYIIDVPTPIDKNKLPNLTYIQSAIDLIKDQVKQGTLIILESTTYPGTTKKYIVDVFSELGYAIGSDLYVAYSPERIDPGNQSFFPKEMPRIVAGYSKNCLAKAQEFLGNLAYPVANLRTAELTKLYENTFRLVNIALADELQKIADNLEIDAQEVIEAAATKPFGFMKFTPNLGIGGHCIPVDPYYLTWIMNKRGMETPLIQTAGNINDSMLDYYLNKIITFLKTNTHKELTKMNIAIVGITYKKNVADIRMSSVLSLVHLLKKQQVTLTIYDDIMYPYQQTMNEKIIRLDENYRQLKGHDLVIYAVDHDIYSRKKENIIENSQLFYDLTMR